MENKKLIPLSLLETTKLVISWLDSLPDVKIKTKIMLSDCCVAPPTHEIFFDICSECKNKSLFFEYIECQVCGENKIKGESCEICNDWKMD